MRCSWGLVIETRLEVSEWRVAAGAGRHRELKDDVLQPSSPYATADDLEDLQKRESRRLRLPPAAPAAHAPIPHR